MTNPYPLNQGAFKTYADEEATYPLKVMLLSGYTYDDAHQYVDDISGDEIAGSGYARVTLTGVSWSTTDGTSSLLADACQFATFTDTAIDALVVFSDRGADSASPLIAYKQLASIDVTADVLDVAWTGGSIVDIDVDDALVSVAGVSPDSTGDVPVATLATAIGVEIAGVAVPALNTGSPLDLLRQNAAGSALEFAAPEGDDPIFVTAAASATVDLTSSYSGGRPVVVVVSGGYSGSNRASVLLGNPSTYVGQRVDIVPDATQTQAAVTGTAAVDNISGPLVGWDVGATPAVLGDFIAAAAAALGAAKDWDFASTPESFDLTVNGTAYTAALSADYTGDIGSLLAALGAAWLADGAPVSTVNGYLDTYGERIVPVGFVTTATGSGNTMSITDAGTGDRINLSTLTATAGADAAYRGHNNRFDALGELNGGAQTHAWPDTAGTNKTKRLSLVAVASPTPQWAAVTTAPRSEDVPYTPAVGSWATNVGNALNALRDADGIVVDPSGIANSSSTDAQAVLEDLDAAISSGGMPAATYDPATIAEQLVGLTATQTLTNKTISGASNTLSNLAAGNLSSGTVPTARLGSGTADSTTFLRGDNTWATPSGGGGAQIAYPQDSTYDVPVIPIAHGGNAPSAAALSLGNLVLYGFGAVEPTTFSQIGVQVTATSLTAGQQVHVGLWEALSDGDIGDVLESVAITVGTSTGYIYTTSLTFDLPAKGYIGVLNPSGNAGTVTLARQYVTWGNNVISSGGIPAAHLKTSVASIADLTGETLTGNWSTGPSIFGVI